MTSALIWWRSGVVCVWDLVGVGVVRKVIRFHERSNRPMSVEDVENVIVIFSHVP